MKLKEFIEKFVCANTIVRLWKPIKGGHKMLGRDTDEHICMEWELLKGSVWQSNYLDCEVEGVTDIITDSCREAVNIVIVVEED